MCIYPSVKKKRKKKEKRKALEKTEGIFFITDGGLGFGTLRQTKTFGRI